MGDNNKMHRFHSCKSVGQTTNEYADCALLTVLYIGCHNYCTVSIFKSIFVSAILVVKMPRTKTQVPRNTEQKKVAKPSRKTIKKTEIPDDFDSTLDLDADLLHENVAKRGNVRVVNHKNKQKSSSLSTKKKTGIHTMRAQIFTDDLVSMQYRKRLK